MAYALNMTLNHLFGAILYALPWYKTSDDLYVRLGFIQSLYGFASFAFGSFVFSIIYNRSQPRAIANHNLIKRNQRLSLAYIITGIFFYIVMAPFLRSIPSIGTFVQSGWSLIIVGFCLSCWNEWHAERESRIIRWLLISLILPIYTITQMGFLGYGVSALIIIFVFVSSFYTPKWKILVGSLIVTYLGLSLFVTYFRDRPLIRETVWYEKANIAERVSRVFTIFTTFEFIDLSKDDHLHAIDARLNQNTLVGMAVDYLESGNEDYARGETLWHSFLAVVPRMVWPEKPVVAGSMGLVSQYTGLNFVEGTSVGIGQVMEFYINYGTICVLVGFFILGALVSFFDIKAAMKLKSGDGLDFAMWFLPGIGFLQAGGSLVEVTSTVAASLVFCIFINRFLFVGLLRKKHQRSFPSA